MRTLVILLLPLFAAAQNETSLNTANTTPGAVLAGIVIAVCVVILFLALCSFLFRRRRRGLNLLPHYRAGPGVSERNQNQRPYQSYPMSQQQPWGGQHIPPPPPPPPPREESLPPPPYPGKQERYETEENSGYGYPNPPPPDADGGLIGPPPHTPPPVHFPAHASSPPP